MKDAAQRQRRSAAKAARRKAVVAAKRMEETSASRLAGRIRVAAKGVVVRCLTSSALFEDGIGHVILARALPSGLLGCGFFLVDVFCLGVKDTFYSEMSLTELQSRLDKQDQEDVQSFINIEPAYARKLIRDAVAYAAGLGLSAAKDTPLIETIFGDVNADACTETFTFGKDGKPFFMSGPYDTPARIRAVSQILNRNLSVGGWNFIVEASPEELSLFMA